MAWPGCKPRTSRPESWSVNHYTTEHHKFSMKPFCTPTFNNGEGWSKAPPCLPSLTYATHYKACPIQLYSFINYTKYAANYAGMSYRCIPAVWQRSSLSNTAYTLSSMATSTYDLLAVASLTFHKLDCQHTEDMHAGSSAWNALPVCLNNNALSLSNFSHQLKHFYFSSY